MVANLESEFKRIEIVKLDERNFENLKFFWRKLVLLRSLFWTSGDVWSMFQCQRGSLTCVLCHLHAMGSSGSLLVQHLLTPLTATMAAEPF